MKEIVGCIALRVFNSDIFLMCFGSIKSLNREATIQNNQFSKKTDDGYLDSTKLVRVPNEANTPLKKLMSLEILPTIPLIKVALFVFSTAKILILVMEFF